MKIFIYPHINPYEVKWTCPRTELIINEGFSKIPEVEIVNDASAADYIIWHHVPQYRNEKSFAFINRINPKKLIVIDSIDECDQYFLPELSSDRYFLYFKRSLIKVDQQGNRSKIPTIERQYPWDYAILDGFKYNPGEGFTILKDIDVGCYLRNSCNYRYATMINTYNWANSKRSQGYHVHLGEVSNGSRSDQSGKVTYDQTYFNYLARTRIVVSSGPYGWCGDSRGAEAVANKCLYFSNEFFDLMPYPPQDLVHWMKFNPFDGSQLSSYLHSILNWKRSVLKSFVETGYEHCMKYHTSKARCKYILEKIEENNG